VSPCTTRVMAFGAFLAAAVAGWNLAGSANPAAGKSPAPANTRISSGRIRPASESRPPAWALANLESIQHAASLVERMRAIIALANSVPLSEIPKWLDGGWFRAGEGFDSTFFTELLLKRWEQAEPLDMAQWRMRKNPPEARSVLMRLAESDPEKVIALLKERPSGWIEIEVLAEMTKFHPELAVDRFMELALGGMGMGEEETNAASFLDALAKNNPELLEARLDSLPAFWETCAKDALVGQRLIASFDGEIRKLWNDPDGWMRFSNNLSREGMLDKLFGELANLPPSWRQSLSSSDWLIWQNREKWWGADLEGCGFTAEQAKKIRMTALERMTNDQPETAIQWLDGIELSAKERSAIIEKIFQWGARLPEESAGLLQCLTTEEDRRAAQAMLDRRAANQETVIPPINHPAEWLEKVAATKPNSGDVHQYRNMLVTWEPAKLNELAARLHELPGENRIKVATVLAAQSGVSSDPLHGEALRCLVEHPASDPKIIQKTSIHAVKWALKNPSAASSWAASLPAGEPKQWAQNNLAAAWAQFDPEACDRWLGSLPESDQSHVREFLAEQGAR